MDMKKLIQTMTDIEKGKTHLNESSVAECGEMGMPAPAAENPGNPVTASVTLNASGMDHVADLMRLLQQAGLEKAGPVAPAAPPMRTDMENLRDKMAGLEGLPSEPKPQYFDVDDVTGGGDDIHSKKEPEDIRIKDSSLADDVRDSEIEEWDNEPEEEYQDHNYMLKDLAGGINREKRQYRAAQPGDNAMAVESDDEEIDMSFVKPFRNKKTGQMHWQARNKEGTFQIFNNEEEAIEFSQSGDAELAASDRRIFGYESKVKESIKDRLYRALSEKKAKLDSLDLDGNGDTEEPMKKVAEGDKGTLKRKLKKTVGQIDRGISKIAKDQGRKDLKHDTAADKRKVDAHVKSMSKDQASDNLKKFKSADKKKKTNEAEDDRNELTKKLFPKRSRADMEKADRERNRKMNQKRFMKPGKPSRSGEWNTYEAEYQAPTHEIDPVAKNATNLAQKIKRKINSGEPMDDRDYNQMAELGAILSRYGAKFGPKSMKDVMNHMKQYTDDRNQEGHGYPEFDVNRFKELISMAKSTGESTVSEISPDLAKRYTKNAKVDRDNTDHILKRDGSTNDWKTNQELQKRNSKRTKGINRAAKRM